MRNMNCLSKHTREIEEVGQPEVAEFGSDQPPEAVAARVKRFVARTDEVARDGFESWHVEAPGDFDFRLRAGWRANERARPFIRRL